MRNYAIKDIRTVDELGRITVPMEIRKALKLSPGDKVTTELNDGRVILEKIKNAQLCDICVKPREVRIIDGIAICDKCINKFIKKQLKQMNK